MSLKNFIHKVEDNRGVFKNTDKVHSQLETIYYNGSFRMKQQASEMKMWGITLISQMCEQLSVEEQDNLLDWFYENPNRKIYQVKDAFNRLLMEK